MTPSVANKTPIPTNVWRRHTDPPGLWISVVIGSVSLHLLAFWLMRSSNAFSLWFPQQSQSAVPIEFINIAPKSKSTTKIASPKPLSSTQRSLSTRSLQTAQTTPRNQDFGARNSADNLQQKSRTYASQPNSQPFSQQTVPTATPTPTPIFTPKATPKSTPTPIPTVPVGDIPWNRRQEIKLGKGTLLPTGIPSNPPVSEAENRETPRTPTQETLPTPTREIPATPTKEAPATSTEGASVAIVAPMLRDEVSNLIQIGRLRQDALPDVIALYSGSNTKQLDSSFLPRDSEVKPAQLLASLVIDHNGNFQQALVIEIEPATLQSEKSTYEGVLNQIFKTENFLAAHNNNGTKPDLSNLFVRIKIQPVNSN